MCHDTNMQIQTCTIFQCRDGIMMLPPYYRNYWPALDEIREDTGQSRFNEFLFVSCMDIQLAFLATLYLNNKQNFIIIEVFFPFLLRFARQHNIPQLLNGLIKYKEEKQIQVITQQSKATENIKINIQRKAKWIGLVLFVCLLLLVYRLS